MKIKKEAAILPSLERLGFLADRKMNITPKEKADIIRKACQRAYCMDCKEFQKLYPDRPMKDWDLMSDDFIKWFCKLDSQNAARFTEGL